MSADTPPIELPANYNSATGYTNRKTRRAQDKALKKQQKKAKS